MSSSKKNLFAYFILTLFVMSLTFALYACLWYDTRATEREYLRQGGYLIFGAGIALTLYFVMRAAARVGASLRERTKTILAAVCLPVLMGVGLWLRLTVIARIPLEPASDFATYEALARQLYDGTLLSSAGDSLREYVAKFPHTIGYPLYILLPVFRLTGGVSVRTALWCNCLYDVAAVPVVYGIGRRCGGRVCGMLAACATAVWPSHVFYATMMASEPSFTFYILLATYLMARFFERGANSLYAQSPARNLNLMVLIGLLLGFASAIRPMAVILLIALCVVLLAQKAHGDDPVRADAADSFSVAATGRGWACALLAVAAYALAGTVLTGNIQSVIQQQPATGLAASGYNMMVGVNTSAKGEWNQEDADYFSDAYQRTGSAEDAQNACLQKALERIRTSPLDVLDLMIYKFRDLWQTDDFGIDWNLLWAGQQGVLNDGLSAWLEKWRPVGRAAYMGVILFSLIGALRIWHDRRRVPAIFYCAMLFFLGTALLHMLLETQVRYHYNMIPYLVLMSAMGLASLGERSAPEPVPVARPALSAGGEAPAAAATQGPFVAQMAAAGHLVIDGRSSLGETEPDASAAPEPPAPVAPAAPDVPEQLAPESAISTLSEQPASEPAAIAVPEPPAPESAAMVVPEPPAPEPAISTLSEQPAPESAAPDVPEQLAPEPAAPDVSEPPASESAVIAVPEPPAPESAAMVVPEPPAPVAPAAFALPERPTPMASFMPELPTPEPAAPFMSEPSMLASAAPAQALRAPRKRERTGRELPQETGGVSRRLASVRIRRKMRLRQLSRRIQMPADEPPADKTR